MLFSPCPSLLSVRLQLSQSHHYHDFFMRVYAHSKEEALAVVRAVRKSSLQLVIGTQCGPNIEMDTCDLLCGMLRPTQYRPYEEIDAVTDVSELSERSAWSAYFKTPEGYETVPVCVPHGLSLGFDCTIDVPVPLTQQFLVSGVYRQTYLATNIFFVPHIDFKALGSYSDSYLLTFYSRRVSFGNPPNMMYPVLDCRVLSYEHDTTLPPCVAVIVEWTHVHEAYDQPSITTDEGMLDIVAQTRTPSDDGIIVRCLCMVPSAPDSVVLEDDVVHRLFVEPKPVHIDSLQVETVNREAPFRMTAVIANILHQQDGVAFLKFSASTRAAHYTE